MTFNLYIMRHAKSDWSGSDVSDFDRPINSRGETQVKAMGQWMADNGYIPQHVISSSALRAKQTTALLLESFVQTPPEKVSEQEALYLADMATLLGCIDSNKEHLNSLMIVGHNPGLEELIHYLALSPATIKPIKTANLAIFEYSDSEFDIYRDKGKLIAFIERGQLGI